VIIQILRQFSIAFGVGLVLQLLQNELSCQYLSDFLKGNLINILLALLAINSATMGIVITKIKELTQNYGHADAFRETHEQFFLAIKEQVVLIFLTVLIFIIQGSKSVSEIPHLYLICGSLIISFFVYSIMILYDTAKSVLIMIDFD
jgi:uncharacterized membrane protein